MSLRPLLALALTAMPVAAVAQDYTLSDPGRTSPYGAAATPDLVFTLKGGVASKPEYFGADSSEIAPYFGLGFGYFNLGGRSFGSLDPTDLGNGFGLRGSFRYVTDRDANDFDELSGLNDIDESYEIGTGIGYRTDRFEAFADIRYGFGGHESFVGEIGADARFNPTDRLTLTLGPRLLVGSDDYASTYFDISPEEAARSSLSAYDADGGVLTAGLEFGAAYDVTDTWGVEGAVTWDRFTGDAETSPIVEQGDRDQYGLRVGVTRLITLDF